MTMAPPRINDDLISSPSGKEGLKSRRRAAFEKRCAAFQTGNNDVPDVVRQAAPEKLRKSPTKEKKKYSRRSSGGTGDSDDTMSVTSMTSVKSSKTTASAPAYTSSFAYKCGRPASLAQVPSLVDNCTNDDNSKINNINNNNNNSMSDKLTAFPTLEARRAVFGARSGPVVELDNTNANNNYDDPSSPTQKSRKFKGDRDVSRTRSLEVSPTPTSPSKQKQSISRNKTTGSGGTDSCSSPNSPSKKSSSRSKKKITMEDIPTGMFETLSGSHSSYASDGAGAGGLGTAGMMAGGLMKARRNHLKKQNSGSSSKTKGRKTPPTSPGTPSSNKSSIAKTNNKSPKVTKHNDGGDDNGSVLSSASLVKSRRAAFQTLELNDSDNKSRASTQSTTTTTPTLGSKKSYASTRREKTIPPVPNLSGQPPPSPIGGVRTEQGGGTTGVSTTPVPAPRATTLPSATGKVSHSSIMTTRGMEQKIYKGGNNNNNNIDASSQLTRTASGGGGAAAAATAAALEAVAEETPAPLSARGHHYKTRNSKLPEPQGGGDGTHGAANAPGNRRAAFGKQRSSSLSDLTKAGGMAQEPHHRRGGAKRRPGLTGGGVADNNSGSAKNSQSAKAEEAVVVPTAMEPQGGGDGTHGAANAPGNRRAAFGKQRSSSLSDLTKAGGMVQEPHHRRGGGRRGSIQTPDEDVDNSGKDSDPGAAVASAEEPDVDRRALLQTQRSSSLSDLKKAAHGLSKDSEEDAARARRWGRHHGRTPPEGDGIIDPSDERIKMERAKSRRQLLEKTLSSSYFMAEERERQMEQEKKGYVSQDPFEQPANLCLVSESSSISAASMLGSMHDAESTQETNEPTPATKNSTEPASSSYHQPDPQSVSRSASLSATQPGPSLVQPEKTSGVPHMDTVIEEMDSSMDSKSASTHVVEQVPPAVPEPAEMRPVCSESSSSSSSSSSRSHCSTQKSSSANKEEKDDTDEPTPEIEIQKTEEQSFVPLSFSVPPKVQGRVVKSGVMPLLTLGSLGLLSPTSMATGAGCGSSASSKTTAALKNKVPRMVTSLKSGFNSEDVLKDCLKLIHGNPEIQRQLGRYGGATKAFLKLMKKHEDDAQVQKTCCAIVRDLAENDDMVRLKLVEDDGLTAVLVALLKHEYPMELQVNGLAALANLSLNAKNRVTIHDMSGVEVLKTCMEAYMHDSDLQIQACRVIANLSEKNNRNAKALHAQGLGRLVMQTMEEHYSNKIVLTQAFEAVRSLTAEDDMNRASFAGAGVLELIIEGMKSFEFSPALQAAGCGALWNMTIGSPDNADTIVSHSKNEGLTVIFNAMKVHNLNVEVQEAACGVLRNLADREDHARKIGRYGGIAPIFNAMRQHESVKGIQAQGCAVLCQLCVIEELKGEINKTGGVGLIVGAMRTLEDSVDVQKQACRAFRNLANSAEARQRIGASGGIAAMLSGMKRHWDNTGVQVLALGAIRQLIKLARNQKTIISNDGVAIIQSAMDRRPNEMFVQQTGSDILAILSKVVDP